MKKLEDYVRCIPDFPSEGVMFRDITSVIQDPDGLKLAIDSMIEVVKEVDFDVVVGTESRGFIFGMPIAYALGKGFVPCRKKGKLPCETVSASYDLEYGSNTLCLHKDALTPEDRVLIVDDILATGGTLDAMIRLVGQSGATVAGCCMLMELDALGGRKVLGDIPLSVLLHV